MTELHVIAGFLGAGKTSAVKHLLRARPPAERVAVVVNDFGEARVDPALLADGRATIAEIGGSCVCCTAPAGFVAAVGGLLDSADRIFVEPTGLARPADLVDTIRRAPWADRVRIGPLVVLVDPHLLATDAIPADGLAQAALADVLVANRVDLATPAEREGFHAWARGLWPGPMAVHETTFGALPPEVLSWPAARARRVWAPPPAPADHGFVARSWQWPAEAVFHRGRVLEALATPVARAKGVLRTDEGTIELQQAGGRVHEAPSGWRRDSRLDVIVARGDEAVLDRIAAALAAAELDPGALQSRGTAIEIGERSFDRAALRALPGGVDDVAARVPGRTGAAARLVEVLRAAGVPEDRSIVVVARDGYTTPPTPIASLGEALLVHSLGDGPLPDPQGGPFRLLVPGGTDACANVKAVVRLAIR